MEQKVCIGCKLVKEPRDENGRCGDCIVRAKVLRCTGCKIDYDFFPDHVDYELVAKRKVRIWYCNVCYENAKCTHPGCKYDGVDLYFCDICDPLGALCAMHFVPMPLGLGHGDCWECLICRDARSFERVKRRANRKRALPAAAPPPPAVQKQEPLVAVTLLDDAESSPKKGKLEIDLTEGEVHHHHHQHQECSNNASHALLGEAYMDEIRMCEKISGLDRQIETLCETARQLEITLADWTERLDLVRADFAREKAEHDRVNALWLNREVTPSQFLADVQKYVEYAETVNTLAKNAALAEHGVQEAEAARGVLNSQLRTVAKDMDDLRKQREDAHAARTEAADRVYAQVKLIWVSD